MILQNGCNLNWLQPFLNTFCGQCLEALATALDGDFSNSPFLFAQNWEMTLLFGEKQKSANPQVQNPHKPVENEILFCRNFILHSELSSDMIGKTFSADTCPRRKGARFE